MGNRTLIEDVFGSLGMVAKAFPSDGAPSLVAEPSMYFIYSPPINGRQEEVLGVLEEGVGNFRLFPSEAQRIPDFLQAAMRLVEGINVPVEVNDGRDLRTVRLGSYTSQ